MADDDRILSRIDEHMARGNEHMARGNELMEEIREQHRINAETYKQGMEFMAHLAERTFGAIDASVESFRQMREQMREQMRVEGEQNRAEMKLVRERMEAQTEAIFRMLDRLDSDGGQPAT